jgi:hypothetical protein
MRPTWLRLGLAILLAGLLTPFLKDFVGEVVVLPLLYGIWFGRLVIDSIPQAVIWAVFVAAALLVAGRSLLNRRSDWKENRELPTVYPGRIKSWAWLIDRAGQEHYARWRLARELRKLTIASLAQETGWSEEQTNQMLKEDRLNLPPDIQAYLQASMTSFSHFSPTRFLFWTRPAAASGLELDPERVVQYLEERHDR